MQGKEPSIPELKKVQESVIPLLKEYENHAGWKQTSDNGKVKIFSMEVGEGLASKGIAVVNFPIAQVMEFINSPQSLVNLNPDCVKDDEVYNKDGIRVQYMQYKAPWPVSWRDFITVIGIQHSDNKIYEGSRSCDKCYPYPQQNKIVRGEVIIGGWILEKIDENTTKVTYISNSDIKGSIPGLVKNQLAKNQGQTAGKLEDLMKKQKK